jgi:hypothetical protein
MLCFFNIVNFHPSLTFDTQGKPGHVEYPNTNIQLLHFSNSLFTYPYPQMLDWDRSV